MGPVRRSLGSALGAVLLVACAAPSGESPGVPSGVTSAAPSAAQTPNSSIEPATSAPAGPVLPTTEPTGPSWTPRPAEALLLESIVSVSVDRLNVRAKPTIESKSLGVVKKGEFLYVDSFGPFSHDGYTWYHAGFVGRAGEAPVFGANVRGPQGVGGWIAVAKGDSPYVKRLRPRCPSVIDTASLQYMLGSERLACFGDNTIELTGTFGCGGCGGAVVGIFEPDWLAYPLNFNLLADYPVGDEVGNFGLRFAPDGPVTVAPPAGSVIRVRVHADDPGSATCAISVVDPLHPNGERLVAIPSEAAHLICAQELVVETMEVLGTDPGFIFG